MFNFIGMYHNPRYFPQPAKFRPERFLAGDLENEARHPYAFLPFGLGPRNCMGQKLALLAGLTTLAVVLPAIRFELDVARVDKPVKLTAGTVSLAPAEGVWLRVMPRK